MIFLLTNIIIFTIQLPLILIINIYILNIFLTKVLVASLLGFIVYRIIKKDFRNTIVNRYPYRYSMFTFKDHFINILSILIYISIFIFGILWLRFHNYNRIIDLGVYKHNFINIILKTSIIENIINLIIVICIIIIYIVILVRLNYYFKFQLIRRHLYLLREQAVRVYNDILTHETYYEKLLHYLGNNINLNSLYLHILQYIIGVLFYPIQYIKNYKYLNPIPNIKSFFNYECYRRPFIKEDCNIVKRYLCGIIVCLIKDYICKIHYFILAIVLLYDIIYNNMVISNFYMILPYTFIYEMYVKISRWLLCRSFIYDAQLNYLIHFEADIAEGGVIIIGNKFITQEDLTELIKYYLINNMEDRQRVEIFFGKRFYVNFIVPIENKYYDYKWEIKQILKKKDIKLLDIIVIINVIIIINILIKNYSG